jgi:hypothetical protein
MKIRLLLPLLLFPSWLAAQELLCNVNVDASRIQSDRTVFEDMQQNISRYLNFQKWTETNYEGFERIRCNLQIVVVERPSPDFFVCNATIQVFRPTFNSTYETLLVNLQDAQFSFTYVPFQQMVFVDNTYSDNLTALLNFYAYLILGFDYDSYELNGGMPYFRKAQDILNQAGSAAREPGWRSSDGNRNRFWLMDGLMNNAYQSFHAAVYKYHRKGLDQMESSPAQGRRGIMESLRDVQAIYRQNPLSVLLKTFLDAKDRELVRIFTNAFANDKQTFVELMQEIDPSNSEQYSKVIQN